VRPMRFLTGGQEGPLINPTSWKMNSQKFAAFRGFSRKGGFPRKFIADSSALAIVMVGWVYLLSSSFSFPELLVGFPMAHPSLLLYFSCECVEGKVSEVRGGSLSSLCLSAPCRCPPSPPPGRREVIG
jgi:hypothetical protein